MRKPQPRRRGCGPQIVGRVAGVLKMTGKREAQRREALPGERDAGAGMTATLEFAPPVHVRWARMDAAGRTTFISAFYATPAGAPCCCAVRCWCCGISCGCWALLPISDMPICQ